PIGHYDIRAQAPGFRTAEKKDVTLTIDQRARIDFQLVVGETRETGTITGETPILKTDDSSTSQVITQRAVVDLPLNARNFMQLTRLTASVHAGDGYMNHLRIGGDDDQGSGDGQCLWAAEFQQHVPAGWNPGGGT